MKKTNSFLATCTLISKNVFIFVSSVDDFISLNFITLIFQNIHKYLPYVYFWISFINAMFWAKNSQKIAVLK